MLKSKLLLFLLLASCGCVPLQQQASDIEDIEIEGFIAPVLMDVEQFNHTTAPLVYDPLTIDSELLPINNKSTYEGIFAGKHAYLKGCRGCIENPRIIQNKLVLTHTYSGGASNRESTQLLWNGKHYQNSNGQYVVDVVLFSDVIDIRRALLVDKKIFDVTSLQQEGTHFVWINLVGYKTLIGYTY